MEPADSDDVAQQAGDAFAGEVTLADGSTLPVTLSPSLVDAVRRDGGHAGIDLADLKAAVTDVPAVVDLRARTDLDTTATIPVQDYRQTDLANRLRTDTDFRFIQDPQIQRLIQNSVNYTERVGRFLLARDDLIPTVKERLKALITGEDGLTVDPADPDDADDQRLAEHLQELYDDGGVNPTDVIDTILKENMMSARAVLRATDLKELDLRSLDYLRDGITGEEIYVQDRTTVYTFDVDGDADGGLDTVPGIDLDTETVDPQPLVIGEHVFDISLYDTPPLEAVADTAVNKMVLQRLKARKAEITSFGAVYATVEPPSYLPEDQYFDRVADEAWDGEGSPPTKLERALKANIQAAFDTLKDFQSGTVMAVPDFWKLEQLSIPEADDTLDDQIRGYNRDISRRLLVPLDLIELQSGSELSRETMFATLMTTIAGWRREILRLFDDYAAGIAQVEGLSGDVTHVFPPLKDADAKVIIQSLQYAGVAGLTETEVRTLLNTVQGIDLDTDPDGPVGELPQAGGPDDRAGEMRQFLDDRRRGAGDQPQPPGQPTQPAVEATARHQRAQDGADDDSMVRMVRTLEDTTNSVRRTVSGSRDSFRFDLDFGMAGIAPPKPSVVDVQAATVVTTGRLALPKVPQRLVSRERLEARIDDILADITDADMPLFARVAQADPDWEPFVDIGGGVDPALLERLTTELPRAFMQSYNTMTAADSTPQDRSGDADPPDLAAYKRDQTGVEHTGAMRVLAENPELPDPPAKPTDEVYIPPQALLRWVVRLIQESDDAPDVDLDDVDLDLEAAIDLLADWNPALHPRGPDGKFVKRPYNLPGEVLDLFQDDDDLDVGRMLEFAADIGHGSDIDDILADDRLRIDGIPDDINDTSDLKAAIQDGRTGRDVPDADPDPDPSFDPDTDFTKGIPSLPQGGGGHGTVDASVIDPLRSPDAAERVKKLAADGEIDIGNSALEGEGPYGIDVGLAGLMADLVEDGDTRTSYANISSHGSPDAVQPYLAFPPGEVTEDDMKRMRDRIQERLPDGFRASYDRDKDYPNEQGAVRIRPTQGSSFAKAGWAMRKAFTEETGHDSDFTNTAEGRQAMRDWADGMDLADRFGMPTNRERAALDRAMIGGVRHAMLDQESAGLPDVDTARTGPAGLPSVDSVDFDDSRFQATTLDTADVGDIVGGLDALDRKWVGEVVEKRDDGSIQVRRPSGAFMDVSSDTNARVSRGMLADDPLFSVTPSDDPAGGRWDDGGGVLSVSRNDIIRWDDDGTLRVGRIIDENSQGATVVKPDGDLDTVTPDQLDSKFVPESDISDFVTERSGPVDIMTAGDTPAARRAAVDTGTFLSDQPLTADDIENQNIPEGAYLAREWTRDGETFKTLVQVTGYGEFLDRKQLEVQHADGGTDVIDDRDIERRGWKPYQPRPETPTVDIALPDDFDGWDDPEMPRSAKRDAILQTISDVVPKHPDRTIKQVRDDRPIDDHTFQKAKTQMADELARARSQEHAERVIASLGAIGNEKPRAHATPDDNAFEGSRGLFVVDQDEDVDTIVHELGHHVGYAYGFRGGSNDRDGQTYPMPSFKWQADDVFDKYAMKTPYNDDRWDPGSRSWQQPGFFEDDWRDEVDGQVGMGLDGRNFTKVDYDRRGGASQVEDTFPEGGMVRFENPASFNGPQNFIVRSVDIDDSSGDAGGRVELEDRDGNVYRGTIQQRLSGDVRVRWDDDTGFGRRSTVAGKRQSVPDGLRESPPDADGILGSQDISDPDDAMRNLADKVNKAWYRQAAASRELGEKRAEKYSIISGYSAKQGHETMSRIHEVMRQNDVSPTQRVKGAQSLLKFHPDLLEAYRQVYDIPTDMKQALNAVAEREGIDYRFDTVPRRGLGDEPHFIDRAVADVYDDDGGA